MEVFLIRHAESEGNRQRRGGGTYDWQLSVFGRKQAQALRKAGFTEKITHVYSSPLIRARETAEVLSDISSKPLVLDNRLIDVDAGYMNGATWVDIRDKFTDFFQAVPRNPLLNFPGGGETNRDVIERTRAFANDLKNTFSIAPNQYDRTVAIAVVSHGLPLNYLILHLLEHEPIGIECMLLKNAAVAHISFKFRYPVLISFNDVRHLVECGLLNEMHNLADVVEERGPAG